MDVSTISSESSYSHPTVDTSETCPTASPAPSGEQTTSDNTAASGTDLTAVDDTAAIGTDHRTSETSTDVESTKTDDPTWSSTSLTSLSKLLPRRACTRLSSRPRPIRKEVTKKEKPNPSTKTLSKPRPKRKELTTDEKVELLVDAESQSLRKLAIKYEIGRRQVRNIIRSKRQIYKQSGTAKPLGRMRAYTLQTGNEEINLLTWQWYKRLRDADIPVTGAMCQQKAREFARELRMNGFKGSNGWLQSFRKRHNITFITRNTEKKPDAEKANCSKKLPDIIPDDIAQLLQATASDNISDVAEDVSVNDKQMSLGDDRSSEQSHMELPPSASQMQQNTPEWTEWNKFIDSTFNEMAKRVLIPGQNVADNYHSLAPNYSVAAFPGSAKDHDAATSFRPPQAFPVHDQHMSGYPGNQRRELIHDVQGLPSCQIASQMEAYPPSLHVPGREMYAQSHGPLKELYPHLQPGSLKEAYPPQLPHGHVKELYPLQQARVTADQTQKPKEPDQATRLNTDSESGKTQSTRIELDNLYDVLRVTHQLTLFFRRTSERHLCGVFEQAESEVRTDILTHSKM